MNAKLLVVMAFLAARHAFAAMAPGDFANVKWGASFDEAIRIISGKSAKFERKEKQGEADTLVFSGGTFAARPVEAWRLFFEDGRFNGARVQFAPEGRGEDQYRKIKSALAEIYGTANDKQVASRRPGHFVLGLGWRQSGADKAPLSAKWITTSGLDKLTVEIRCWLERNRVRVQYGAESPQSNSAKPPPTGATKDF